MQVYLFIYFNLSLWLFISHQGDAGKDGPAGPPGPTGEPGLRGEIGLPGKGKEGAKVMHSSQNSCLITSIIFLLQFLTNVLFGFSKLLSNQRQKKRACILFHSCFTVSHHERVKLHLIGITLFTSCALENLKVVYANFFHLYLLIVVKSTETWRINPPHIKLMSQ